MEQLFVTLCLKNARIELNDPQKKFAFRIGVAIPTLHSMEQGSPKIGIGKWAKALDILNRLDDLGKLIAPQESLVEQYKVLKKIRVGNGLEGKSKGLLSNQKKGGFRE